MDLVTIITVYVGIVIVVCIQILLTTSNSSKALAYIMFSIFIPVVGMGFYLIFGEDYWNKKRYRSKLKQNQEILEQLNADMLHFNEPNRILESQSLSEYGELATMLERSMGSPVTKGNDIKILLNGERKFPELMQAIQEAQHHIHIEYYIFRSDDIGTKLLKLLIEKAKQGVEVRLIYDDFGSPNIDQKLKKQLQDAGAAVFPFYEIKFYLLANRYNYRNHRKLVVIDGSTAFLGGINVADEYINDQDSATYWRDTHLLIKGPAIYYLQYLFMTDWKFCCPDEIKVNTNYFKEFSCSGKGSTVQIAASGPDSAQPAILYSLLQAMYLAKKEILITTPYFVPGDSFMDALCAAALSALKVKLLVPKKTDSKLTDAASNSFFAQLLEAGAEVYLYKKGLLHSKTIVIDSSIGIIGTANMDHRSFELNFEVNAIVYDEAVAKEMRETFFLDLESADQINKEAWLKRPWNRRLPEKIARLFSPVL